MDEQATNTQAVPIRQVIRKCECCNPGPSPRGIVSESRGGIACSPLANGRCWVTGTGASASPTSSSLVKGAVGFGGIEEGDTALMRRPQRPDGLLAVRHVAIGEAQSEAAIADGRDFEALSKDMRLHQRCPFRNSGLAEHGIDAVLMETRQRLRWHGRKVWHRRTRPGLALGVAGCEAPPSHHRWGRIPAPAARAGWRHGSPVTG